MISRTIRNQIINIDNEYMYHPIIQNNPNFMDENRARIETACENLPYVRKMAIKKNTDICTAFLLASGIDLRSIYKKFNVSKYAYYYYTTKLAHYICWRLYPMFCSTQYTSTELIKELSLELINELPDAVTILPNLTSTLKNIKKRTFKNNSRIQFKIDYNSYGKDISYFQNIPFSFSRALIPRYQYAYMKFHYLMSINRPKSSDIANFEDKLISKFKTEISSLPNGKQYCTNEKQWNIFRRSYRKIHDFAINNKYNTSLPKDFNEIVQLLYYYVKKYSKSYSDELISDCIVAFYELENFYFFHSTTLEHSSIVKKHKNTIINTTTEEMEIFENEMYSQLELFAITSLQCMSPDDLKNAFIKISSFTFLSHHGILANSWSMPLSISQNEWIQKRYNFIYPYRTDIIDKLKELLDIDKLFQKQPNSYNIDLFLIKAIYHLDNKFFKKENANYLRKVYHNIFSSTKITSEEKFLCRYIIFNEYVRCYFIKHTHTPPSFFDFDLAYFDVKRNTYPSLVIQRKNSILKEFKACKKTFIREVMNLYFHHYCNAAIIPILEKNNFPHKALHILTNQKLNVIDYLEQALTHNKPLYEIIPNLI